MLDHSDVSRIHGKIRVSQGTYSYTDLGSANGSRLNNQPALANQECSLKIGDRLSIGDFVLAIEHLELSVLKEQNSRPPDRHSSDSAWSTGELTVRCVRVVDETVDVKTFTFIAQPVVRFDYKPGQFVTLELVIDGETILRSYSISSTPSRPHTLEITVKRVPGPSDVPAAPAGLVSNWLHDTLKVGSLIKLTGALGRFTCAPIPAPKLLLISAGSGITPMMSMSRWLTDTVSPTDILFFHCARTPNDIIFRQELESMAARSPNFRAAISITRSPNDATVTFPLQPWLGLTGRLTDAMLQTIAPDFLNRTVYVCGPDGFMQGVKTLLTNLNFPMQNYYAESFGTPKQVKKVLASESQSARPAAMSTAQPIAYFAQSQKEMVSDGNESILDLAAQAGIKIRSSCKQGVCGACKKRKLEGSIRYESEPDGLDRSEQDSGMILTCVATPIDRVVIEA